jgi:hypothetical protein
MKNFKSLTFVLLTLGFFAGANTANAQIHQSQEQQQGINTGFDANANADNCARSGNAADQGGIVQQQTQRMNAEVERETNPPVIDPAKVDNSGGIQNCVENNSSSSSRSNATGTGVGIGEGGDSRSDAQGGNADSSSSSSGGTGGNVHFRGGDTRIRYQAPKPPVGVLQHAPLLPGGHFTQISVSCPTFSASFSAGGSDGTQNGANVSFAGFGGGFISGSTRASGGVRQTTPQSFELIRKIAENGCPGAVPPQQLPPQVPPVVFPEKPLVPAPVKPAG